MPTQRTARRDQNRQREQAILACARDIVREHGFLGMRVSEVAKAAGVSVGTFYTHFESREDLIMALACQALSGRLEGFKAVLADEGLGSAERLVVGVCIDFLFAIDHAELFAAEQLSSTSSVWDGASDRRARELSSSSGEIMRHISAAARDAIDGGEFEPWPDPKLQAASIDRGIWTLMAGSAHVHASLERMDDGGEQPTERALPDSVLANVAALFRGYGWRSEQAVQDVEQLAKYALGLPTFTTTSAGADASQSN